MLIEHDDPIPVDDETEEQLTKNMSSVPSRSGMEMSAAEVTQINQMRDSLISAKETD